MFSGKRLKEKRKENKLTQAQLSDLTGISIVTISRYENDSYTPTYKHLLSLVNALNCTLKDLENNEDDIEEPVIFNPHSDGYETTTIFPGGTKFTSSTQDGKTTTKIFQSSETKLFFKIQKKLYELNLNGLENVYQYIDDLLQIKKYKRNKDDLWNTGKKEK